MRDEYALLPYMQNWLCRKSWKRVLQHIGATVVSGKAKRASQMMGEALLYVCIIIMYACLIFIYLPSLGGVWSKVFLEF
jgi:hypothetical protein